MIDVAGLRAAVAGEVLTPSAPGFEKAHLGFNLAERHHPDVVVCATSEQDVVAGVLFAVAAGLPVRVQATGHGIGLPMTEGVLISTAAMRRVGIQPTSGTAVVGPGARWHQVLEQAAPHGLTGLCGSSPDVGVVGYTLGGGMGPMARTFGFNADKVRRLRLVDARGRVVEVDQEREPDLFWALRGGKPDVGIVTEIEFELLGLSHYYGGAIFYPGEAASTVFHAFAEWAPGLPESVSTSIALLRLPDVPEVPEPLRGRLSVHLRYVHVGDPVRGAALLAPMRQAAAPIVDLVDLTPASAIGSVHQDPVDPMPVRDEGLLLRELPTVAIDALLAQAGPDVDVPLIIVEIRLMGGALTRSAAVESAVGGRDAAFSLIVIGPYPPPLKDAVDAASAAVLGAVEPWATTGSLINFQGYATAQQQVRAAWPVGVRARLDDIKQAWDPGHTFRFAYTPRP